MSLFLENMGCITSICGGKPLLEGDNEYESLVVSKPNPIFLDKVDFDDDTSSDIPLFQVKSSDDADNFSGDDNAEDTESNNENV